MSIFQNLFSSRAKTEKTQTGTPTYVVGFSTWKLYLRRYFPTHNLIFLDKNISEKDFNTRWRDKLLSQADAEVLIWGFKPPQFLLDAVAEAGKKVKYVEDGFIRSLELGATKVPPISLTVDDKALYYDATTPSELEDLLSSYDFEANAPLLERADAAIKKMVDGGIGKFNNVADVDIEALYGPKNKRRVLVLGQLEDSAAVELGCDSNITNSGLVKIAAAENPNAQIIYKPHPEASASKRSSTSDPRNLAGICSVIEGNLSLSQALHEVDQVYTATSLGGFEALLRGIPVTTLGSPFYAGWGITDDRQRSARRQRKLSLRQIFAGAYLLYANYFDPNDGKSLSFEEVLDKALVDKAKRPEVDPLPKISFFKPVPGMAAAKPAAKAKPAAAKSPAAGKAAAPAKPKPAAAGSKPAPAAKAKPAAAKPAAASKPAAAKPAAAKPAVAAKPPAAKPAADDGMVPDWFNSRPGNELKQALASNKPKFLYVPWIAGHGDALVEKLASPEDYLLAPLDFVNGIDTFQVRHEVLKFCRLDPALYRKLLINRLVPIRKQISGVIFTFDWSPVMSMLARVCADLEIPRILVPHESVFVDREKYYWDVNSKASVPVADMIFGWGGLQREIFTERGYPEERFQSVGAPKFDTHVNYDPKLSRAQYCALFGLDPNKKIILFASQPLDSQLVKRVAQDSQRKAISDLFAYAKDHDAQLLVRLPPNKEDILGPVLRKEFKDSNLVAADEGQCYLVSPEEALYHADVVTSINSTMLFEGILIGRPALSLKYVEFEQIWQQAGIPSAHNAEELKHFMDLMFEGNWSLPEEGMTWAASMFGIGKFDGQAASRIQHKLSDIAHGRTTIDIRPSAVTRLLAKEPLDVVAIPSGEHVLESLQKYLQPMVRARSCVSTAATVLEPKLIASAEIFFQWGAADSKIKRRQREIARELGRPVIYIEDGFIRSLDIGLSKEPGMSIILDDTTAYYDATQISRLARLYQSGAELTSEQTQRSRAAIDKIVAGKVSKYNHAPNLPLKVGKPERKKILLVDQRFGDVSVEAGLGSEAGFQQMLMDAIRNHPDCDILIKQHPDAIKGGKSSYYSNERLEFTQYMDNVFPILFDVNPYSLFAIVDEVYVMTSGMGFEALMAGKKVHCYGMPFYAGWGVTEDVQTLPSRTRTRSLEELFHFAYIESSRYYSPKAERAVEVEELVDYIMEVRGW